MNPIESVRRKKANKLLYALCRIYHDGIPINEIDAILTGCGFNKTEPAIYCGRDGHSNERVGERTWITITWHKMDVSGRYEIVAYLS